MTRYPMRDLAGADPYRLLGVPPTATSDEIAKAYRRRVRSVHPDLPTGSEEQTKLLTVARDILLDPVLRAEYDRMAGAGQQHAAPWVVPAHDRPVPPTWIPPQRQAPGTGAAHRADLSTLSVLALVMAVVVPPAGIVIGAVALSQRPAPTGYQRTFAMIAIAVGTVLTICCGGYLFWITS
jgi:hypothetical protein